MKKVGLFVKKDKKAHKKADEFESWLKKKQIEVIRKESSPPQIHSPAHNKTSAPRDLSCLFVLGGDGTFLSAVRWIGNSNIPVLGIKFGEVGFMAEVAEENLFSSAEKVLKNEFKLKPRMRLYAQVKREGKIVAHETVLNDVVINKGALARLARIDTYIDDHYLTTYSADGLIIATPTGSTAYSLAAGGPVVHPEVPGIIMTPICPHTLTNRPVVLPATGEIELRAEATPVDVGLTIDGQVYEPLREGDRVVIRRAAQAFQLVDLQSRTFYDTLREKLHWGGSTG